MGFDCRTLDMYHKLNDDISWGEGGGCLGFSVLVEGPGDGSCDGDHLHVLLTSNNQYAH